ncbi:wax ester/triacylglycerol synthase domain-containing protein, partial [Demequina sp.]|uniref:wax ester/triacylglycerol synthase domain-containing protein n=1 Tax=Demequina sp. TaxID=2050685 RepID=UPI0025E371F9
MASPGHRISATDHTELLTDVGPVPKHVGALLALDHADAAALLAALGSRLATIDRFSDRLLIPRNRLRRPSWRPDAGFDVDRHLAVVEVVDEPDAEQLIAAAVREATEPLPRDRPLWRAAVVAGPDGRAHGIVLTMHHVLADGLGGLAVLQRLVDEPPLPEPPLPVPAAP